MRAPGDHKANGSHAPQPARPGPLGPLRHTTSQGAVSRSGDSTSASQPGLSRSANPPQPEPGPPSRQPKLLDRLAEALRSRHYSPRTEQTYRHWVKRYIFFHNVRHPAEMAEPEINTFLTHLAAKKQVSASTQNQALSALLFLYRHVLGRPIGDLGEVVRARRPTRLPVVLTRAEVKAVLGHLTGDKWLMASLMYGAGLRLMECLRLRIHDVDLPASQIVVRDGKGF
jgi:site-specific recombinase XerD